MNGALFSNEWLRFRIHSVYNLYDGLIFLPDLDVRTIIENVCEGAYSGLECSELQLEALEVRDQFYL